MRPSLTRDILEHIVECGAVMLDAFFPPQYPQSRITRNILRIGNRPKCRHKFLPPQKYSVSSLLSRLRKQGLVVRSGSKKRARWSVTKKGGQEYKKSKSHTALQDFTFDLSKPDGITRLLIFDIPEDERKKRDWLRAQLVAVGFKPLQKSVWIGGCPLPEDLLKKCDILGLTSYIHLVSLDKKGTLQMQYS